MTHHSKQSGSTAFLLLISGLIGLFAYMVVKLAPVYIQTYKLRDVFSDLSSSEKLNRAKSFFEQKEQLKIMIGKKFRINDIDILPVKDIKIKRSGKGFDVSAVYEVETPLFANISFLTRFNESARVELK